MVPLIAVSIANMNAPTPTMKAAAKTGADVAVTFGNVTIHVTPPSAKAIQANIQAGQKALKRACSALINPGFILAKVKGVPYYYGFPDDPDLLIRDLDGEHTIGRMSPVGRFIPLRSKNSPPAPTRK